MLMHSMFGRLPLLSLKALKLLIALTLLNGCGLKASRDDEAALNDAERQINAQLEAELKASQIELKRSEDRLKMTVEDDILFTEGGWEVTSTGKALLDKLIPTLINATDRRIEVHGYTDNVPIGKNLRNRFPTNWELSCARAAQVVRYLQAQGINPSRLAAVGHGEYQPVGSNASPVGRRANRRTDIVLLSGAAP